MTASSRTAAIQLVRCRVEGRTTGLVNAALRPTDILKGSSGPGLGLTPASYLSSSYGEAGPPAAHHGSSHQSKVVGIAALKICS